MRVQFGLLGPLTFHLNSKQISISSPKQRAMLAALLLRANHLVSTRKLAEALWGDQPPESAEGLLRTYAWRLRRLLCTEKTRLRGRDGGYQLRIEPGELDTERFAKAAVHGHVLMLSGQHAPAAAALSEALAEWRGPLLADTPMYGELGAECQRLTELWLTAAEDRIDAELALSRHRLVVPELRELVAMHPLRERLTAQLMVALYRSGRRAEALDAYTRTHRILRDQLGLDPGPALEELQQAILSDDANLGPTRHDTLPGALGAIQATATYNLAGLGVANVAAEIEPHRFLGGID